MFGHDERADRKIRLEKCSNGQNYAILYMKLTACLADIFRGLDLPGRMGETCLRMRASTLGGDTLPRKNCLQTCTVTEKLAL